MVKQAGNQPARLCCAMSAWALETSNREKAKGNYKLTIKQWGQQRHSNSTVRGGSNCKIKGNIYKNLQSTGGDVIRTVKKARIN